MSLKKQSPPSDSSSCLEEDKYSKTKDFQLTNSPTKFQLKHALFLILFLFLWFLLPWIRIPFPPNQSSSEASFLPQRATPEESSIPILRNCELNLSVYVYELPEEFNAGLLENCHDLNVYTDMCPHVANSGLGQKISGLGPTGSGWFATHQFMAETIFHARMESHPCRERDPSVADLFYVPFYGGLHASSKFREPDLAKRDELALKLASYLQSKKWWNRRGGEDHFLALGRTAWDFMRTPGGKDFGANCLLNLPPIRNVSVLTVERHPWEGLNQHGIPYPSYFHPSSHLEIIAWQRRIRTRRRRNLFSFAGGRRPGVEKAAVRDEIVRQCAESALCELLLCGEGAAASKCHDPREVLAVMMRSKFCVQAPGDSFTRRSTFDSVMAGCVPVFFSPHTAYTQYEWYLPGDREAYSVYINGEEDGGSYSIEAELMRIPEETVEAMRERVVSLMPSLVYANPNATDRQFHDAVDVALVGLSMRAKAKLLSQM